MGDSSYGSRRPYTSGANLDPDSVKVPGWIVWMIALVAFGGIALFLLLRFGGV